MSSISKLTVFLTAVASLLVACALSGGNQWPLPAAGLLFLMAVLSAARAVSAGLLLALAGSIAWIVSGRELSLTAIPIFYPVVALILGIACAFLGILASLSKVKPGPVPIALGRMAVALHFLTAGLFLSASWLPVDARHCFAWAAVVLSLVLTADTFVKLVSRLYTPRRHWDTLPAPGAFFFFRWFGKDWRACFPPTAPDDDSFSLKLPEMWMWPALRRQLPWLTLVALILAWAGSAFHEVGVGKSGVRQTCGTWEKSVLTPGFHVSLPWPLGNVRQIDTGRIHETVLGFRSDPGQPILWERAHYEGEEMSLVGGGDDLLSISVPIHYRIADPVAFFHGSVDPGRLVRDTGSRALLDLTIQHGAAQIMTSDREAIREKLHESLQAGLDREGAGIGIVGVFLRDVHPPVKVAPAFQDVLAAMEDKEALIHDGESYRFDFSTRSRGDAFQLVVRAESTAENRLARAGGEVNRFISRRKAWEKSRGLFEMREGFAVFDAALADTKKAIFDERIRSAMTTQLDLRKVLNPDLIDNAPTTPESLVPAPSRSREAFDLDIEGFLRADLGEAPAASATPDDPDNLMRTQVPDP